MSTWEEKAFNIQKMYYTHFAECQWSEFDIPESKKLLRSKICYALYGAPMKNEDNIEDLYEREQQEKAEEIIKKLLSLSYYAKKIKVGFLFIACKQKEEEFTIPIFRVFSGNRHGAYVDTECRTYKNWDDWKENNTLPKMKYCYPKSGYYTCQDGEYIFDEKRDPVVEFGESPSSNLSSKIFRSADTVSGILSLATAGVAVVGMFTPLAPAVAIGSMIVGTSSATYGATRIGYRLYDKGTHGEDLADFESAMLWVSLAATPLNFATSAMNGVLRGAAVNGRILTSSIRTFATILNFTTLGVDSVMIGFGLFNLIEKGKNKQLSPLDVAQFSMSVFFFTNTLIQPKVASQIIAQAQDQHINRYLTSMTDEQAQISLKKFVEDNKASGTITDNSKIIRTINRIDDPGKFFKNIGDSQKVMIGGRKGKTVLVTDASGQTSRINPNRVLHYSDIQKGTNFDKTYNGLTKCLNKDLKDVKIKGVKIFDNMNEKQKTALEQVFEAIGGKRDHVVQAAYQIAEALGCQKSDEFAFVIGIVAAAIKGLDGIDILDKLNIIQGIGKDLFVNGIKNDRIKVQEIAKQKNLKSLDDLKAVYYYRMYGPDFLNKEGCKTELYLDEVSKKLIEENQSSKIKKPPGNTVKASGTTQNDSDSEETDESSNAREPGAVQDNTVNALKTAQDDSVAKKADESNNSKEPRTYKKFQQKLKQFFRALDSLLLFIITLLVLLIFLLLAIVLFLFQGVY